MLKRRHFTKTGSGQTYRYGKQHSKGVVVFLQEQFRRSLPLDALLERPGASAVRNAGRGEGEVTTALRRSVDAASLITFGTGGAVQQMY